MTLQPVRSSNVVAVGHEPSASVLVVEYVGAARYRYDRVSTELFAELLAAQSIGKFVQARIVNNPDHPCAKLPAGWSIDAIDFVAG